MSNPFLHNYHSHTTRCGHAVGTDEAYVEAAIEAGFKTIGFSDHVILPSIHQPRMRGDFSKLDDYINSVLYLREKYKDKIDVKLAFECEYAKDFEDYYRELLQKRGFDYLILGQHCYFNRTYGEMEWYSDLPTRKAMISNYTYDLLAGMESGLFAYVCHPDLFMIFAGYWDEDCEAVSHEICKAAERLHLPLELNMGRTRYGAHKYLMNPEAPLYPHPNFFEIVSQYDIDVIVGVDAHSPKHYFDSDYEGFAEILRKLNLKWLQKLDV